MHAQVLLLRDALPTIRDLVPEVAVIMVSGVPDAEVSKRALAFGAFDYVMKPVDLDDLTWWKRRCRARSSGSCTSKAARPS
jgi:response regulator of citrate/malate metabolism